MHRHYGGQGVKQNVERHRAGEQIPRVLRVSVSGLDRPKFFGRNNLDMNTKLKTLAASLQNAVGNQHKVVFGPMEGERPYYAGFRGEFNLHTEKPDKAGELVDEIIKRTRQAIYEVEKLFQSQEKHIGQCLTHDQKVDLLEDKLRQTYDVTFYRALYNGDETEVKKYLRGEADKLRRYHANPNMIDSELGVTLRTPYKKPPANSAEEILNIYSDVLDVGFLKSMVVLPRAKVEHIIHAYDRLTDPRKSNAFDTLHTLREYHEPGEPDYLGFINFYCRCAEDNSLQKLLKTIFPPENQAPGMENAKTISINWYSVQLIDGKFQHLPLCPVPGNI